MRATKPQKPYKDFPLTAHPNGTWCKKIKGKLHHFGGWADPEAALAKYRHDVDDLQAGRDPEPMPSEGQLTAEEICNEFLDSKFLLVESGELSKRMHFDYVNSCKRLCELLGRDRILETLRPKDFDILRSKLAVNVSKVTLANRIRLIRVLFKFANDRELVTTPLKFSQNFKLPDRATLRAERQSLPAKLFEADELRNILCYLEGGSVDLKRTDEKTGEPIVVSGKNKPVLKAMVLLAINCAFGQNDCSMLPITAIDLERGWVNFPRPKTHVPRRCPLWPETVAALQRAMDLRPSPIDARNAGLMFLTTYGQQYVRVGEKGAALDAIAGEFDKIRKLLEITGGRRTAFYSLRRTFETIASDAKDQIAVDEIMGHAAPADDMGAVYRQRIDDNRLIAVTSHVRKWLWPNSGGVERN